MKSGYLIFDIGTGNYRVVIAGTDGTIHAVQREDVSYERDYSFPDSLYFDPEAMWDSLKRLSKQAIAQATDVHIQAITATSQREGIVLFDENGDHFLGLPNHDNRGKSLEDTIIGKDDIYLKVGRRPTTLFSALKLMAIRMNQPEIWEKFNAFTSISDWITYLVSGKLVCEHSQATETLLYDVRENGWSESLCDTFGVPVSSLPKLVQAGTVLGTINPELAEELGISHYSSVIVGGADTQMSIKGTQPNVNDYIINSGTTTPVVKVIDSYQIDEHQRTWTNGHVEQGKWIFEANCGVTGLNYQRLKAIFYPNESYRVMESEIASLQSGSCVAALGSLLSHEQSPLKVGAFLFEAPISHELKRAHFVRAAIQDIVFSIAENFQVLHEITGDDPAYVWGTGGGFQSHLLRQYLANLLKKEIRVRKGYEQSAVIGCVFICNDALGVPSNVAIEFESTHPVEDEALHEWMLQWKTSRQVLRSHPAETLQGKTGSGKGLVKQP